MIQKSTVGTWVFEVPVDAELKQHPRGEGLNILASGN